MTSERSAVCEENVTLTQLLIILRARWLAAFGTALLVLLTATVITLLLPKKFTASASVVLDVKSPDPIAGVLLPGMTVSSYMGTQVDIVQSERVLIKAVRTLGLNKLPEMQQAWQEDTNGEGDFEVWLTGGLTKTLEVRPSRESNVIAVTYTSKDPDHAARAVNAIVKGYIDTTVELRSEPARQFNSFFDENTRVSRQELEAAQTKLSGFQQRNGIVASDERLDIENTRLAELSSQMVRLQAELNESSGRANQATSRGEQMQEVMSSPLVIGLSQELARLESRQRELNERLGVRHPQVQEQRASVEEMRSKLAIAKARATGGLLVNESVNKAKLQNLQAALESQRLKVLRIKSLRDEANLLQRDVENAQRVYEATSAKMNQSSLESQATQTNVSVLKAATRPVFPSSPRIVMTLSIALALGAVLGIAVAILRERNDWRLRTTSDIVDGLSQPLLGVLTNATRLQSHPMKLQLAVRSRRQNEPSTSITQRLSQMFERIAIR